MSLGLVTDRKNEACYVSGHKCPDCGIELRTNEQHKELTGSCGYRATYQQKDHNHFGYEKTANCQS